MVSGASLRKGSASAVSVYRPSVRSLKIPTLVRARRSRRKDAVWVPVAAARASTVCGPAAS
jgi:hypothetical protein